jgi:hypothetical protein
MSFVQDSSPQAAAGVATASGHGPLGLAFHERRRDARRPVFSKAVLTVLDGPGAGESHEVQARNISMSGICFLLRTSLSTGQLCRIAIGGSPARLCEIVRSRMLSNGKYEMGVEFRKG